MSFMIGGVYGCSPDHRAGAACRRMYKRREAMPRLGPHSLQPRPWRLQQPAPSAQPLASPETFAGSWVCGDPCEHGPMDTLSDGSSGFFIGEVPPVAADCGWLLWGIAPLRPATADGGGQSGQGTWGARLACTGGPPPTPKTSARPKAARGARGGIRCGRGAGDAGGIFGTKMSRPRSPLRC